MREPALGNNSNCDNFFGLHLILVATCTLLMSFHLCGAAIILPITCKVGSKTEQEIKIPYVLNLILQGEWNYDCPSVVACRELKIWMIIWRFYSNYWAESLENEK